MLSTFQAVSAINVLLDKADHQYRQLQTHKSSLDALLVSITDHSTDRLDDAAGGGTGATSGQSGGSQPTSGGAAAAASSTSSINKNIQQLAQKYCGDCRTAFEELSKIIQVPTA